MLKQTLVSLVHMLSVPCNKKTDLCVLLSDPEMAQKVIEEANDTYLN